MRRSISEIAQLAGVSKTTVSLVMNDQAAFYGISKATEARIRAIAKKCHYIPSSLARGLRLKRTHTIGLIVPDLNNWFFSQLSKSLEKILRETGYRLYVISSYYNEDAERKIVRDMMSWHVDGLIIASVMKQDRLAKDLFTGKTPIVYIDRSIESDKISWVASDNYQGSYDLVDYMCSKGAREICYLGGARNVSTLVNRFNGYRDALAAHGIPCRKDQVFERGSTPEDGYDLMKDVVQRFQGLPPAIYAASCDFAVGLLRYLKDVYGQIPPQLRIGTFDNDLLLDFLSVKIPSVQQDTDRLAWTAFRLISQAMKGKMSVKHELVKPTLCLR